MRWLLESASRKLKLATYNSIAFAAEGTNRTIPRECLASGHA
jgi:hypothetical protein